MNRSVLLVICDFFILTLLSFVKFDSTAPEGPPPSAEPIRQVAAPALSNMVATLETALELERQQRDNLTNALAEASAELAQRLRLLAQREESLTEAQRRLATSEAEARRLAEERAKLEKAQGEASASVRELQQAFETARETTGSLQSALTNSVREAADAKARLAMMEQELQRRREESQAMQDRLQQVDQARERLREEKQQLALELTQTATEAKVVRESVTNLSQQLAQASVEKVKLIQTAAVLATNVGAIAEQSSAIQSNVTAIAEQSTALKANVSSLAEQSTAIKEQMDRQTRLPANTIYATYLTNRVRVETVGTTRGGLGQEVNRRKEATTVLVRMGGRVYAVLHVEETALRIWPPDAPWTALGVGLGTAQRPVDAPEFTLARRDPRVVAVPLDDAMVASLGAQVFEVATDPAQFAEAVVIGAGEAYYGECAFRLNPENAGYLQMERSTIRRLLGEFSPRRGDLAFSKTGAFLGILVNGDQCLGFDRLELLPPFRTGATQDVAWNTALLKTAQSTLERLPAALR